MRFLELALPGVYLIEPECFSDSRGQFRRHFCADEFKAHGIVATVAQANISENPARGTLRGFHFQISPFEEAKTLSCLGGALFDIVVDLRPSSPRFMTWISVEFSTADRRSLHVPAGCANAWLTTEPNTTVHYYMSASYKPEAGRGLRYNDPAFGFRWPFAPVIISERDLNYPDFDRAVLS